MAKQTIKHGAELDFVTPDELKQIMQGREAGHSGLFDVIVGDFSVPAPELLTSPPAKRLRITKQGSGGDAVPVLAASVSLVLQRNEGRMGGQIVNYGAFPCFLYLGQLADLATGEIHNRPAMWVSASGGTWDFQLSSLIWGGTVCAQAIGGDTTLTVVEI